MLRRAFCFAIAWTVVWGLAAGVQADVGALVLKLPPGANAVIGVDLQAMLASPVAARLGWKDKYSRAFSAGTESLPPHTLQAVAGINLDLENVQAVWQAVALSADYDADINTAVARFNSQLEDRGGVPGFPVGATGYIAQFGPRLFGAMAPVTRQTASRWIRDAQAASQSPLTPYLSGALQSLDSGKSIIVLALDLQDALDETRIRARLGESAALSMAKLDLDSLAKLLATMQGVTLNVGAGDTLTGEFIVDFGASPAELVGGKIPDLGRQILIAALANHGVALDELAAWDSRVSGNRLYVSGELQVAGYRRIMTLVNIPLEPFTVTTPTVAELPPTSVEPTPEPASPSEATASLEFFQSIDELLQDLAKDAKRSQTIGQNATWMDRYADKIDRLPSVGVDEELIQYSVYVTQRLRDAAGAIRGIGINSAERSAQITPQYYAGGGGYRFGGSPWGGGGWGNPGWGYGNSWFYAENNYEGQRRAVRQQERATGFTNARSIMAEIQDTSSQVRRKMTQKYGVNF